MKRSLAPICSLLKTVRKSVDTSIIEGIYFSTENYDFGKIIKHHDAKFIKKVYELEDQESQICAESAPELFQVIWSQAKDILEGRMLRRKKGSRHVY